MSFKKGRCRETDKENQIDVKAEADVGAVEPTLKDVPHQKLEEAGRILPEPSKGTCP